MVSIDMESPAAGNSSSLGSTDQDCTGVANESSDFDESHSVSSTPPPKLRQDTPELSGRTSPRRFHGLRSTSMVSHGHFACTVIGI